MRNTTKSSQPGRGIEIPRPEWEAFCRQFSQDHQEWSVDVAQHGEDIEALHEAQGLPFEALTLHLDHTHEVLSIIVRKDDATQGHTYQSVPRPNRVMIERTGSDVRLHIHSIEGSQTIVRFRRVATPDYDSAAKGKTGEVLNDAF